MKKDLRRFGTNAADKLRVEDKTHDKAVTHLRQDDAKMLEMRRGQ